MQRVGKSVGWRIPRFLMQLALLAPLVAGTGCAGLGGPSAQALSALQPVTVGAQRREIPDRIVRVLGRPDDLWGRIAWGLSWQHDDPAVQAELTRILAQPQFFEVLSERANPALAAIVSEVERQKLPMELALLPIVESMLDPWAYSSQRAAGLWQISPATAAHYGLEVNWWYDARLDIPLATEFALSYLSELRLQFNGDWHLAVAAYNGGRGRVARAIAKAEADQQPADFWHLTLPKETRRYLPRLLALAELIKHPARYNLTLPALAADVPMVTVSTGGQIELARAAQLAGLNAGELRRLNPGQLRWATAPEHPGVLWLPASQADRFKEGLAALPDDQRVQWAHYRIAPGDSLIAIARRFNTRVQLIRTINDLEGNLIRAGDTLMIPRGKSTADGMQIAMTEWPPRRPAKRHHHVRKGDSLWTIAQRYGLDTEKLAQLNQLDPKDYLQPGQTLRVRP